MFGTAQKSDIDRVRHKVEILDGLVRHFTRHLCRRTGGHEWVKIPGPSMGGATMERGQKQCVCCGIMQPADMDTAG